MNLLSTTKLHRLEKNIGEVSVEFNEDELNEIGTASSKIYLQYEHYTEHLQKPVNR